MVSNKMLWLWSMIAVGLGFCGGYLFSSKFCKVSIVKRVNHEIALNQNLRKLLAQHAFWIHQDISSTFFKTPDQPAIEKQLIKNQEGLANFLGTYYSKSAATEFAALLNQNTLLINQLAAQEEPAKENDLKNEWRKNSEKIATLLSELNPEWARASDMLKLVLNELLSLIIKETEALQKDNWPRALEIFDQYFEYSLQIADELDRGITQQFSNKF